MREPIQPYTLRVAARHPGEKDGVVLSNKPGSTLGLGPLEPRSRVNVRLHVGGQKGSGNNSEDELVR